MNKLLKDAIADAKAVRETALAQAKLALEEAFAPKLQSMLSNKIKEEMEEEPKADAEDSMEDENMRMQELAGLYEKEDEMDMEPEEGEEDMDMEMEPEEGDEEDFSAGDEDEMGDEEDFSSEEEEESDEDLEEILRQLEEEEGEEMDDMEDENIHADLDPNKKNARQGEMAEHYSQKPQSEWDENDWSQYYTSLEEGDKGDFEKLVDKLKDPEAFGSFKKAYGLKETSEEGSDDEEINLEELIQALREEDGEYEKADDQAMDTSKGDHLTPDIAGKPDPKEGVKKMKKMEEELNEAYTAVKYLREKLSEVNLLNAKLLYVNKLFRKNGLTEAHKVKIIETFDRAKNVREAKLIYATLSESVNAPVKTKKPVVENFASAPVKKTKVITEGNEQMNRFKTLAGIIKS